MLSKEISIKMRNFRGYIFSREIGPHRVPQHIQNQVIRNYAKQKQLNFLLSSVEYKMNNCFYMLYKTLDELNKIDGVILYSMFMLPKSKSRRIEIYKNVLSNNSSLLGAVEDLTLNEEKDINRWEGIFEVSSVCELLNYEDIKKWLL